jgi:hypothetical protein
LGRWRNGSGEVDATSRMRFVIAATTIDGPPWTRMSARNAHVAGTATQIQVQPTERAAEDVFHVFDIKAGMKRPPDSFPAVEPAAVG